MKLKTRVSRQGTRAALRSLPRHPHAERTPLSLGASKASTRTLAAVYRGQGLS